MTDAPCTLWASRIQSYAMFHRVGPRTDPCGTPAVTFRRRTTLAAFHPGGMWLFLRHLLYNVVSIWSISSGTCGKSSSKMLFISCTGLESIIRELFDEILWRTVL